MMKKGYVQKHTYGNNGPNHDVKNLITALEDAKR